MSDSDTPENESPTKPSPEEVAQQGGRGEPMDPNGPVNTDYQDTDLHLDTVKKFLIASFAVTLVFFVLMLVVHRFYKKDFVKERGTPTAESRQIAGKDQSLLQTQPLKDLADYNREQAEKLSPKTKEAEATAIPVEDAKRLMIDEGAFATAEKKAATGETASVAPAAAPAATVAETSPAPRKEPAQPSQASAAAPAAPTPDPAFVQAGKKIWETQCMAACHTGKRGAIGPNIEKAFGTMRKLENHEPILMDGEYVINSMNNPQEHVAKGYSPVMMSFKDLLSETEKKQVVAYLQSMGKPIPSAPAPKPTPEKKVESAAAPVPTATPVPAPAPEPTQAPAPRPTPAPAEPKSQPTPAPKPTAPSGTIFV